MAFSSNQVKHTLSFIGFQCYRKQRRNFSVVPRYSLKFTRCLLLVVKSLATRFNIRSLLVAKIHSLLVVKFACYSLQKLFVAKIHSLLVAEVARCKKSIVTCSRISSLQKITRYSLQKLLVAKITRYSLQNSLVTRCKKSLVTRCKICLLLVTEVARCKKSLVTRCKICLLLVAEVACCKKLLVTRYEKRRGN